MGRKRSNLSMLELISSEKSILEIFERWCHCHDTVNVCLRFHNKPSSTCWARPNMSTSGPHHDSFSWDQDCSEFHQSETDFSVDQNSGPTDRLTLPFILLCCMPDQVTKGTPCCFSCVLNYEDKTICFIWFMCSTQESLSALIEIDTWLFQHSD